MVDQVELVPCPFCGGEADFYFDWSNAGVECTAIRRWPVACRVVPRTGVKRNKAEAIAAWNTRTPTTPERSDDE